MVKKNKNVGAVTKKKKHLLVEVSALERQLVRYKENITAAIANKANKRLTKQSPRSQKK